MPVHASHRHRDHLLHGIQPDLLVAAHPGAASLLAAGTPIADGAVTPKAAKAHQQRGAEAGYQPLRSHTQVGSLDGKVAFVTGAASGIGRAAALAFAREGANVVVADIDHHGNQDTARMIEDLGGQALAVSCDVTRSEDVQAGLTKTVERFGRMDYAFNNAGAEQQPKASSVSRLNPSRNRKVAGLNSALRSKQQKARPPGARWVLGARWCVHASGDRIARSRWTQPVTPGWAA